MKHIKSLYLFLAIAIIFTYSKPSFAVPVAGKNGMVAADHVLASRAGTEILQQGGNAVDAAVATAFALAVVRPYSAGLGGGGFMVIRLKSGSSIIYDYRERAPAIAHKDIYLNAQGKPIISDSKLGHRAAAVPGQVAGLTMILKKHGSLSLAQVMAPAIRYAEKGILADDNYVKSSTKVKDKLALYPQTAKIFLNHGKPFKVGERMFQSDLAKTLKTIAKEGAKAFYEGSIAQAIVKEMQGKNWITAQDLKNYKVSIRQPVTSTYNGYRVISMPPSSSGGSTIIEMLNILEHYKLNRGKFTHNSPDYIHLLAEVMQHAFSDRAEFMGDSDFVKVPLMRLTDKAYAKQLQNKIDLQKTFTKEFYGYYALPDDNGTTHFSTIDRWGNAVACTETINTYFGSKVVVTGTGIVLNNEMDDFSMQPGIPNAYGLIGSHANSIAAGKRPLSSMSPTIVLRDGKPVLIVGASGGPRIITATFQTILNVLEFGMNIEQAISAPRMHHQWVPQLLMLEPEIPVTTADQLKNYGHKIKHQFPRSAVQGIHVKNGLYYGASDPRKGGLPIGY